MISCAAALLIAFVNPLLCLIHCAFTHQHPALTDEQQVFLCDLGDSTPALVGAPFSAVWSGPRAVYQALLGIPPMLSVVILVTACLRPRIASGHIHIPPPTFPPPKTPPRHVAR